MKLDEIYYHIRQPKEYKNFWKLNQEFSYIQPFASFSKKKNSAKIMYAIYMIYDPKSQVVNSGVSVEEIKKDISEQFLGDKNFPWSEYKDIVVAYKHYSKTKIEKELDDWWLALQDRKHFVTEEVDWEDEPELKESLLLATDKHFEKFNKIRDSLKEERTDKLMHGDYTVSELELWSLEE